MKAAILKEIYPWKIVLLSLIVILHLSTGLSFASEGSSEWRGTYDLVMRWLNFFIFAAVIVKFGAKPLKTFTSQQREEVSTEILLLEKEKREMAAKIDQTLKMGEDSRAQFKRLKERIIAEGERHKSQIIDDAKSQSRLMLEEAKRKVEHRLLTARANFRRELVDAAADTTLQRLPLAVTQEDQEKRLAQFLGAIGAS